MNVDWSNYFKVFPCTIATKAEYVIANTDCCMVHSTRTTLKVDCPALHSINLS